MQLRGREAYELMQECIDSPNWKLARVSSEIAVYRDVTGEYPDRTFHYANEKQSVWIDVDG